MGWEGKMNGGGGGGDTGWGQKGSRQGGVTTFCIWCDRMGWEEKMMGRGVTLDGGG